MSPIDEFDLVVDAIYGVYLDSTTGFTKLREWIQSQQNNTLQWLKEAHPELATKDYVNGTKFIYGKGDPNNPDSIQLHVCTQKQYKERNHENGLNFLFIGNMTLVSIYQYWEDYYRNEIAVFLGCENSDLVDPVMGDIRLLRHSIIHHGGIAMKNVEKCEILRWYKEGQEIFIDKHKCQEIIFLIKKMTNRLRKSNSKV